MEKGTRDSELPSVNSQLRIRPYEPRDHDAVWSLHREGDAVWSLHREGVMKTTPQYFEIDPKHEDDLRNIEARYLTPGSNFWVAEAGDSLVGMTGIQRMDAKTARLRRMRVTAVRRRQGVAQRLLETAERFCRDQGYRRLILDTAEQQTAAHHLYERAGFTRTGERTLGPFRVFDYEKHLP